MTIDAAKVRTTRESKGWSQEKLAKEAGTSQTTVDKIERGETRRSRYINAIAHALGVHPHTLDNEMSAPDDEQRGLMTGIYLEKHKLLEAHRQPIDLVIPVFAAAEGGPGNLIINREPLEFIDRPHELRMSDGAYAVYIVGESMFPEFEPGDRALVNPSLPAIPNVTCIFEGGQDEGELGREATIKRLIRRTGDSWLVRQWNPEKEFDLPLVRWPRAQRVIGKISR